MEWFCTKCAHDHNTGKSCSKCDLPYQVAAGGHRGWLERFFAEQEAAERQRAMMMNQHSTVWHGQQEKKP